MSVCVAAAAAAVRGDTRKTDTSKRKDVKKDGGTQEKRGERLVKNSKYIYSNDICSAEAFFFLSLLHSTHTDSVLLRLIAARAVRGCYASLRQE